MKSVWLTLAALGSCCQAAQEVSSFAEGRTDVGEDGWVLLCYGADWDRIHDEKWMRRQTAIRSASGNAQIIYVPVWQNPTEEQAREAEARLRGAHLGAHPYRSLPCAILLDPQGYPYKTISGDDFMLNVTGQIRNAQAQLRTRNALMRQAEQETGSLRAQTLGRIWRLSIAPPQGLRATMTQADPKDTCGIASISPFDAWGLARRVHNLPWEEAKAELDRMQAMPLSNEERQSVLALRLGCVHFFLQSAGAREVRELAAEIDSLGTSTSLAKASRRAAALWGTGLTLAQGWQRGQLPRVAAPCEFECGFHLSNPGTYRVAIQPGEGASAVRVRGVVLSDGGRKVAEDLHDCDMVPGEAPFGNEYQLRVTDELSHPRLEVLFDQRGEVDTTGRITVHYGSAEGTDFTLLDTSSMDVFASTRVPASTAQGGTAAGGRQAPTMPAGAAPSLLPTDAAAQAEAGGKEPEPPTPAPGSMEAAEAEQVGVGPSTKR